MSQRELSAIGTSLNGPKSLSGIETSSFCRAKQTVMVSMALNPFQGLKQSNPHPG